MAGVRTRRFAPAVLAAGLCAGATGADADPVPLPRVREVTSALIAGRLRIGSRPGDLALGNGVATAIVRKSDGWLVDFWPHDPGPASPQLGDARHVDGLWLLHPTLQLERTLVNVTAERVTHQDGEVLTFSRVDLGRGQVRVTTRYRLHPVRPRLIVTTEFEHAGGAPVLLIASDTLKWGNADYVVEGVGRTGPTFHGEAGYIGRHGAGGDLVLSALVPDRMRLDYQLEHYGFAPAIRARYVRQRLGPGESIVVQRMLSYDDLPDPKVKARPEGTLEAEVTDEHGRPLAAKLSFRGLGGSKTPDFGNDGDERGAGRFVWSGTGRFSRSLPTGRYEVMATAGIERDARVWKVDVTAGRTTRVEGQLPRVITTPGVLSADLHLHQVPSVDADVALSTRVLSVAAEGVELAVASDHYAITDLGPTVAALRAAGKLASELMTMVGTEVSTVGHRFGHFNVFPIAPTAQIDYEDTTARQLFDSMRRAAPDGVIQVNHPRLRGIGYFGAFGVDPTTGVVPEAYANSYVADFDALEVFNGLDAWSEPRVRIVLMDYLRQLGLGRRYAATGNSDSHKLFYIDPGIPRNLIRYGNATDDRQDLRANPEDIVRAIRAGSLTVTTGPVIDASIYGVLPGGTVSGRGTRVPLKIQVRAAPWVDVSDIEVLVGKSGRRARWINVARTKNVLRFDGTLDLELGRDRFVVVLARGREDLPNVHTPRTRPLAFTNPIWVEP